MSKDIVTSSGGGAIATPSSADPGKGTDIRGVSFGGRALTYEDDMPTSFRTGAKAHTDLVLRSKATTGNAVVLAGTNIPPRSAQQVQSIERASIASGVRQLEKPRRSLDRIVQRRVGWNATPTQIMVTTAERLLVKRPDGRLAPQGEWLIENRKTYTNASGPAEKRVGRVKVAQQGADDVSREAPSSSEEPDTFPEGRFALSLLPAQVRASVLSRVPLPTVFDGAVILVSDADTKKETHKEVNVICMDDHRAMVIRATLKPGEDEWEVSQASYSLSAPEIEQV